MHLQRNKYMGFFKVFFGVKTALNRPNQKLKTFNFDKA